MLAYGCVLHMRGPLTLQPALHAKTRDWILWNGEVFGGGVEVCMYGNHDLDLNTLRALH